MKTFTGSNKGRTLPQSIVTAMIVLVALTMLVPVILGFLQRATALRCEKARDRIETRYEEYRAYRQDGETFLAYVRRNVDKFDNLCPSGGRYRILVTDPETDNAAAHVHCTVHSGDFERIAVPAFATPGDALEFASQVYALGELYMAGLAADYDNVSNGACLPFDRVTVPSLGRTVASESEFTARKDGKPCRIAASEEFRALLDYGANALSVGKLYFAKDEDGAYTDKIDYAVVAQDGFWAKFGSEAFESGTGAVDETVRPKD